MTCIKYLNLSLKYRNFQPNIWFKKGLIFKKMNNYFDALYSIEQAWNVNCKIPFINDNYIRIRDELILFSIIEFHYNRSSKIIKKRNLEDPDNFSQSNLKRRRIY